MENYTSYLKWKSDTSGPISPFQKIIVPDESQSFILTFRVYNNATANGKEILVDKRIIGDFGPGRRRKIIIEFENPVLLSSKY